MPRRKEAEAERKRYQREEEEKGEKNEKKEQQEKEENSVDAMKMLLGYQLRVTELANTARVSQRG